jgi:hypothetical protein
LSNPDPLTPERIAERWPRLFHLAEAGSWPSIRRHGLRSTTALLDLFEVTGARRHEIEARRRPESIAIEHAIYGTVWIRDNKPVNETVLRRTLVGMSEPEWYRTLNSRVFFWLSERRLERLRNAPAYRDRPHDLIVVNTAPLLAAHGARVELSALNSGAVHPGADYPRGAGTFRRIADYPWQERRRVAPAEPIVELTVPYAVQDIADLVVDVSTRR